MGSVVLFSFWSQEKTLKARAASTFPFSIAMLCPLSPKSVSAKQNKNLGIVPYSWFQLLNWMQLFIPDGKKMDGSQIQHQFYSAWWGWGGETKKRNFAVFNFRAEVSFALNCVGSDNQSNIKCFILQYCFMYCSFVVNMCINIGSSDLSKHFRRAILK